MTKDVTLIIFGFIVTFTPFLGVPDSWKNVLLLFVGLGIVIIAFLWRREIITGVITSPTKKNSKNTDAYVENGIDAVSQPPSSKNEIEKITKKV